MEAPSVDDHVMKIGKNKKRKVMCVYCQDELASGSKPRRSMHLHKCIQVPPEIRQLFKPKSVSIVNQLSCSTSARTTHLAIAQNTITTEIPKTLAQGTMDLFTDRMSDEMQKALDKKVAKFFYDTGIPLHVADSTAFRSLLTSFRPSYQPPTARQVSGKMFNDAYASSIACIKDLIKDSDNLTIATDGYTAVNGKHLINFVIHFGNRRIKPAAWNIVHTQDEQQNAVNISNIIKTTIADIGVDKVSCVISDNAPNMRAAWDIIEFDYPHIVCNGCGAHAMNLVVKDVVKIEQYKQVVAKANILTSFVNNHAQVLDRFRFIQQEHFEAEIIEHKRALSFVVPTRFYTYHGAVLRNLENRSVHEALIAHHVICRMKSSDQIRKRMEYSSIVRDEDFWKKAKHFVELLQSTTKIICDVESNSCNIGELYKHFINLIKSWQHDPELLMIARDRFDFVRTPSMSFCYFLTPKACGGEDMYVDSSGISDLVVLSDLLPDYIVYKRKITSNMQAVRDEITIFQKTMAHPTLGEARLIDSMDANTWWRIIGKRSFPLLAAAAAILFAIPSSQASSERLWSIYDFIHSKRRNRLSHEKATGLVVMYANAAIRHDEADIVSVMMGLSSDFDEAEDQ